MHTDWQLVARSPSPPRTLGPPRRICRPWLIFLGSGLFGLFLGFSPQSRALQPQEVSVTSLTFSPDGATLYYASLSKQRRLTQVGLIDGKENVLAQGDVVWYSSASCLDDGRVLAGGMPGGIVHLVNPKDGKLTKLMEGGGYTAKVSATPSGLVLIRNADALYLYNAKQEKLLRSISFQQTESLANGFSQPAKLDEVWPTPVHMLVNAALSPDGTTIVVALGKTGVALFPVGDVKKARHLKTKITYVNSLAFAPDGKTLAVGGGAPPKVGEEGKGAVELFSLADDTKKATPAEEAGPIGLMQFSADGKRLVIYEQSRVVRVWDVVRTREISKLKFNTDDIRAVAVSRDGKSFAIGGLFGYEVWNTETGKRICPKEE